MSRNLLLYCCSAVVLGMGQASPAKPPVAHQSAPATPPPACKPVDAPTATPRNLLANPGFELGREPWTTMGSKPWGAFDVVDTPVHYGKHAARLLVDAPEGSTGEVKVFGVVQEIKDEATHGKFPDTLSGYYRVESWTKGDPSIDLYMQAVVIVWGDPRAARLVDPVKAATPITNYQIRFYLAGLEKPPFVLQNAHYVFVTKGPPKTGEWVPFDIPVRKAFEDLWGVVPENYEFLRVLFEGRWDNRHGTAPVHAEVYYDDLHLGYGPAGSNAPAKAAKGVR